MAESPTKTQLPRTHEGINLRVKKLDWPSPLFLSLGAMLVLSERTSIGFRKFRQRIQKAWGHQRR